MTSYKNLSPAGLAALRETLKKEYDDFCGRGLKLDLSRGKPSAEELDLSDGMLSALSRDDCLSAGADYRNYGMPAGIPEMRKLFSEMYGVREDYIIACGNSSLQLMYDTVARYMLFGTHKGGTPWSTVEGRKWLCVVPGYDRHFAITELFGFSLVSVPMTESGPDMDAVEKLACDPLVMGIWCVPKYSNPTGNTYSAETVRRLVSMPVANPDFRIFWDNAYAIHGFDERDDELPDIFTEAAAFGTEERVLYFASTSKVTYPGAGVAMLAAADKNRVFLSALMNYQTIGYDKINQLRHVKYLRDGVTVRAHMRTLGAVMKRKFDLTVKYLRPLRDLGIADFTEPHGGYFISLDVMPGCARRVYELMRQAGVILTKVGATYPYGVDPQDSNLRLAPSYPKDEELKCSMQILSVCVRLAAVEKLLSEKEE